MNYMSKVAEMLGVELGEEFKIDGHEGNFHLSENFGLVHEHRVSMASLLAEILMGRHKIIEIPWKPELGEIYFCVGVSGKINCLTWRKYTDDLMYYLAGNCYRTETEAEAHKPEMLQKMKEVMGE